MMQDWILKYTAKPQNFSVEYLKCAVKLPKYTVRLGVVSINMQCKY